MAQFPLVVVISLLGLFFTVSAIQVTPGSSCAALCIDSPEGGDAFNPAASTTNSSDIVCEDLQYHSVDNGIKYRNCIECLQKSEKVNGTESDVAWLLYNLRYAVDTCLFGFGDASKVINTPCLINYACSPLRNALMSDKLDPEKKEDFGYCTAGNNVFASNNLKTCIACLQTTTNQVYLSNFMLALDGGCQKRPAPGTLLPMSGSLFSQFPVNVTVAPPAETFPAGAGQEATSTMTTGTIVGIAVGGGLLFLGATALFIVHHRKQRKLKQDKRDSQQTEDGNDQPPANYMSGRNNLSPWVNNDHKKSGSFSSYEMKTQRSHPSPDFYDDVDDDMRSKYYNYNPHGDSHGPNSALPTHPAYIPRAMGRADSRNPSPTPSALAAARLASHQSSRPEKLVIPKQGSPSFMKVEEPPRRKSVTPPPPQQTRTAPAPQLAPNTRIPDSYVPPPPPPPPNTKQSKTPFLHLPSVPRIRVPKKYSPPKIVVEGATPVADKGDSRRMRITGPLAFREQEDRFRDQGLQGGPVMATEAQPVDYSHVNDIPIGSGKNNLYGI